MNKQALVVESDPKVADLLTTQVRKAGFTPIHNSSATQSLATFEREQPDLVILDLMSPDLDGVKISHKIRESNERVPILFLATQASQLDNLLEQNITASDYLIKPITAADMLARISALVSRVDALNERIDALNAVCNTTPENKLLVFNDIKINIEQRSVETSRGIIKLTGREFDLLVVLASKPGRVFKRTALLSAVWWQKQKSSEHTVNTHINRLRKKIEIDPAYPRYIQTVWGTGYKFVG